MKTLIKTFKYRVKDGSSRRHLNNAAMAVNVVWNHCNSVQRHAIKHGLVWPNEKVLSTSTAGSGKLIGLPGQTVQEVCNCYAQSRSTNRKQHLRWRGRKSLGWIPFKNQTILMRDGAVRFNKKWYKLWMSRSIEGRIKCGSFSQDARGRWYCNVVVEYVVEPVTNDGLGVGIDVGLKNTATLSTGCKIANIKTFSKHQAALAKAQKARKSRQAKNILAKIANTRKNYVHQWTTSIARSFSFIAVGNVSSEWLQVSNGKSSADAATGMFRRLLRYKAIARGSVFVDVSEHFSTQTCSRCGSIGGPKGIAGLEIREWTCGHCGSVHDRDVNAARNILRLGRETLAEGISPSILEKGRHVRTILARE